MATSTDPRGKVTTYSHDIRGRMWQAADPLGNLTRFDYNSQGLVTRMFDRHNQMTQFAYIAPAERARLPADFCCRFRWLRTLRSMREPAWERELDVC